MKLIKKIKNVFKRIQYEITYLRMEYHLIKVITSNQTEYFLNVNYKRNIGKSCALSRLSAKYNIPIVVPNYTSIDIHTRWIPKKLPKYFKHGRPTVILANEYELRGRNHFFIVLVEEGITSKKTIDLINSVSYKIVGYK